MLDIRPGHYTRKQPGSRARTTRHRPWQNHSCGCRIRDCGEMLVLHRRAVPSHPTRPRAPAKSRSAPGRCDTTTCVQAGGADRTGYRTAPDGPPQTWDHPRVRVTRMGEGVGVPQPATSATLQRPNPPEQAGFTPGSEGAKRTRRQQQAARQHRYRGARLWEHDGLCAQVARHPEDHGIGLVMGHGDYRVLREAPALHKGWFES